MDSEIVYKYEVFLEKYFFLSEPETPGNNNNQTPGNNYSTQQGNLSLTKRDSILYNSTRRNSIRNFTLEDNYNSESYKQRGSLNMDFDKEKWERKNPWNIKRKGPKRTEDED